MTDGIRTPDSGPKYVDFLTGAGYDEKPEHMTQLYGNRLIAKDHPRILFRGKMDSLEALVVLTQTLLAERGNGKLVDDLSDILAAVREVTRCEVLDEAFTRETVLGLTEDQLRERSHDPQKFFQIRQLLLPDHAMGRDYALLNHLRAAVRETEASAAAAFRSGDTCTRQDILRALNRLSSALHIMMCMYLAGEYTDRA